MKYYIAEAGKFWDVFEACIIVGKKYYEAFPVISADSYGRKINPDKRGEYYEKGRKEDLLPLLEKEKIRETTPETFSILSR